MRAGEVAADALRAVEMGPAQRGAGEVEAAALVDVAGQQRIGEVDPTQIRGLVEGAAVAVDVGAVEGGLLGVDAGEVGAGGQGPVERRPACPRHRPTGWRWRSWRR